MSSQAMTKIDLEIGKKYKVTEGGDTGLVGKCKEIRSNTFGFQWGLMNLKLENGSKKKKWVRNSHLEEVTD